MAKTRADRSFDPSSGIRTALGFLAAVVLASPASAQSLGLPSLNELGAKLADVISVAISVGTGVAALLAIALLLRSRGDERLRKAEGDARTLRAALDRTEALLEADDQRTVVWDSATSVPKIFGGLPEHVGAPSGKPEFLAFANWLSPESAGAVEAAIDRLRRVGEGFQLAAKSRAGAVLELTGRTSGRRAVLRLRELSGDRRSFAELKDQAMVVISEVTALRALADLLPFPLWRRNRTGRLTWINAAYVRAVEAESHEAVLAAGIELLPTRARDAIRETERAGGKHRDRTSAIVAGERRLLEVLNMPIEDGAIGCAIDVSEIEALRAELMRIADSNVRTLDQLNAGVAVFGADGRMLFHNASFRMFWNLKADWLATNPEEGAILDYLRSERKLPEQANYRDWRSKHLAAYQRGAQREELWHLPDGRTLRIVAIPNADGGMTYLYENVTQQIMLESRLKSLSQLQGETLDHLSEAVTVFGTDGRLRLFNPAFADIWRLSPARLREEPHIGEIITECQAIHAEKATWDAIRAAVTDLSHEEEPIGRMQRPDGSVIDYATVALPEGMTMLTFVDVTASAGMERVLKERNEALEAADRLKSEFIQHVSYELRSPLTNIIGQAEVLAEETFGRLNDKQREYMGDIVASSEALRALIDDILDLATVDAGIMTLDIHETEISGLAESVIEGLRDRLSEQRIELEIAVPANLGSFYADERRVRQILFNLVSNAIRFSNAGGHIRVEAARRGGDVIFTVTDDGIGIPKEVMPSIFQPFETYAAQGRRAGAGIGLSIVKSLVELHGGEVEIRSAEGRGTTAIVRLPVTPAAMSVAAE